MIRVQDYNTIRDPTENVTWRQGRAEDKGYGDCGPDDGGGTTKSIGARDLPKTDFNCVRQKLQIHSITHDTIARECEGARRT